MIVCWIDYGKFAFLRFGEDSVGLGKCGARWRSDQVSRHDRCDRVFRNGVELDVTAGYHADQARAKKAAFCRRSALIMPLLPIRVFALVLSHRVKTLFSAIRFNRVG